MRRRGRENARRDAGRLPGTRARVPAPEPSPWARRLAVVPLVLAGLGAIWIAPHAADWATLRVRQAPFRLARVEIQGLGRVPAAELRDLLAPAHDVPLVDLDVAALEARLESHPWIARATVLRWPPDALRVRVEERTPLAVTTVTKADGDVLYGVDATGRAFAPADDQDVRRLVAIALASPPVVGEPDPRLAEALVLAAGLRARGLEVPRRVTLGLPDRDASAEIRLRGFAPAIFIERDGAERQLDRLATLLAANVPAVPTARVIDLRFDGRAVLWGGP